MGRGSVGLALTENIPAEDWGADFKITQVLKSH